MGNTIGKSMYYTESQMRDKYGCIDKVHTSYFTEWVKGEARQWNFDPNINYTTHRECRVQPWCVEGRHFKCRLFQDSLRTRRDISIEITQIISRERSNVVDIKLPHMAIICPRHCKGSNQSVQIIGCSKDMAVVQACNHMFLVLNLRYATFVAQFLDDDVFIREHLCECIISPDGTRFVLKPSPLSLGDGQQHEHDYIKIVSIENGRCRQHRLLKGISRYSCIAMDPRFGHRRMAIGYNAWSSCAASQTHGSLCIYDLNLETVLYESVRSHATQKISYSPDGELLAALVVVPAYHKGWYNFPEIILYAADNLTIFSRIPMVNMTLVPLLPAVLFPVFSQCSTRLAVALGRNNDIMGSVFGQDIACVDVYKVTTCKKLQALCRVTIRRVTTEDGVTKLPLPKPLVDYLLYLSFPSNKLASSVTK